MSWGRTPREGAGDRDCSCVCEGVRDGNMPDQEMALWAGGVGRRVDGVYIMVGWYDGPAGGRYAL